MGADSPNLIREAVDLARAGKNVDARDIFLRVVENDPQNELAWMWLAGLVDSLEDKIIACENVLIINPSNLKAQAYLESLKSKQQSSAIVQEIQKKQEPQKSTPRRSPLETAKFLEQDGKFAEALEIYKVEAAKTKDTDAFNEIYKKITRIEQLQADKVQYVSPNVSIARLTFTWPLLYLSLVLIQVGLNPFKNQMIYLWLAFPLVILGSYFIAISDVRSRHWVWHGLFAEKGDGSAFARMTLAAAGWVLVLLPIVLIVLDSFNRLSNFQIPPKLF